MAFARITNRDARAVSAAATLNVNYSTGAPPAGSLLIACVTSSPAIVNNNTCTDSGGTGSWTKAIDKSYGGWDVSLFYKTAVGNETTVQTAATSAGVMQLSIFAYSGSKVPAAVEFALEAHNSSAGTSQSTATLTSVHGSNLILHYAGTAAVPSSPTWTNATMLNSQNHQMIGEYIPGVAKISYSDTATWNASGFTTILSVGFMAAGSTGFGEWFQ